MEAAFVQLLTAGNDCCSSWAMRMRLGIIELFYRTMTRMGGHYLAFLSPDIWVGICAAAASASSASAESALNPNRDQNLDLNGPVLLVLLLTSSSVRRLFVSFRITWHWQNNGANDSSQVAKWQLSADPHFHCRPRRKPHNCPILIHFVSNFSFSLGDRVFFFFFFFCLVAVLLFVCARVP